MFHLRFLEMSMRDGLAMELHVAELVEVYAVHGRIQISHSRRIFHHLSCFRMVFVTQRNFRKDVETTFFSAVQDPMSPTLAWLIMPELHRNSKIWLWLILRKSCIKSRTVVHPGPARRNSLSDTVSTGSTALQLLISFAFPAKYFSLLCRAISDIRTPL